MLIIVEVCKLREMNTLKIILYCNFGRQAQLYTVYIQMHAILYQWFSMVFIIINSILMSHQTVHQKTHFLHMGECEKSCLWFFVVGATRAIIVSTAVESE